MNTFKHSGTLGDIIYALPIMKHFGGGELYLHLHQIDWIAYYYYRTRPHQIHQGKMNQQDFEFLSTFMNRQSYIKKFDVLAPHTEITHNLDKFRPQFVSHPGNYVDVYAEAFGITDAAVKEKLRNEPWLTADPANLCGKKWVINRTLRYTPSTLSPLWQQWKEQGREEDSLFIGLPDEFVAFSHATGWKIDYLPLDNIDQMASVIAGSECFIGNQSSALSIAIGLGKNYICESRQDMPLERNECYFPGRENAQYI